MHISIVSVNLLVIVISLLNPTTEAQQATYLYHVCPNTTTFPLNSTYRANRDSLLDSLSSNGTRGDGFYNTTSGRGADMVYGLFLCRGDLNTSVCQACVTYAANDISQRCPIETTVVVWYDECLLRYSNRNILSVVATRPAVFMFNTRNVSEQNYNNQLLAAQVTLRMEEIATDAENKRQGAKKYATRESAVSFSPNYTTLYTLGQCTPDLSGADCGRCLRSVIENLPRESRGGRVLNPSCNVRYEIYPFYNQTAVPPAPEDKPNRTLVLVATLSATVGILVVSLSGFIIWRRRNSREDTGNNQGGQFLDMVEGRIPYEYSRETFSGENGDRSQEFPSIQLDILHAATDHFSDENRLGEGGFGPVYKGILPDGDVDSEPELPPPPPPPDRTAPARAARAHRPDPPRPARANRGGRPPRR
ncbi:hypothetical protein V6N12_029233 [Hibiscus sabdariffa]|uniref:Gnk2-homologous domain-containing protein n=1 Tax=Hibiscus sabdariffa TaxID=183260 RepID=A0ABR2CVZ8_9ROSI